MSSAYAPIEETLESVDVSRPELPAETFDALREWLEESRDAEELAARIQNMTDELAQIAHNIFGQSVPVEVTNMLNSGALNPLAKAADGSTSLTATDEPKAVDAGDTKTKKPKRSKKVKKVKKTEKNGP